ncbi:MAG: alpha/beta fold hydrolase [Candidatus Rokubacteria bacterium]|nr:alpha/beta fold hydrolase [Candidatus Rokubacteria bacterium]
MVREKTIDVSGMAIFYREAGAGEPILLLHGNPNSSYLWRKLLPRLARFGRAVAPDHYGFGKSDKPADADYSVPATFATWKASRSPSGWIGSI